MQLDRRLESCYRSIWLQSFATTNARPGTGCFFTGEDKMPSKSREDFSRLLMAPLIAAALLVAAGPADAQQNPGVFVHAADDEPTTLDPAQVEPGEGGETERESDGEGKSVEESVELGGG